jgi:hypothetical protein
MESEVCRICGGDGRIGNAFGGSTTSCPGCHGTGRRADTSSLMRDVTKTKPSHNKPPAAAAAEKQKWPTTFEGTRVATEIRDSAILAADVKARLIIEIMDHEAKHGRCTETFIKKMRKQLRPPPP